MAMTGEQLLAAVKRRCGWPRGVDKAPLTDAEMLSVADEELVADARPMVVSVRGEYDLVYKDYTPVAGQSRYRLPARMYDGPRDVCWVDTDGREYQLGTIDLEDVPRISWTGTAPNVRECQFYLEGDYLRLHPAPASALGTLRVKYVLHPSSIVKTTSVNTSAILTVVSYTAGYVIVTVSGTQFNPDNGVLSDIVGAGNAHAALVWDAATQSGLGLWSVPSAHDPLVVAGDWLCAAGYTPIVPLPDAALSYFVYRVAALCLDAADDAEGFSRMIQHAEKARAEALKTLKPRNQAEPKSVVCRNSPLRVGWPASRY